MFLFISGHLYGGGGKRTTLDFYINRVKKVLLPYYLTISTFLLIHVIFLNKAFTKIDIFQLYICNANTTIQGGEHLWYIPLILLCYLLTPIFLDLINYNDKRKMLIIVLILCLAVIIFFHFFINLYFYNPAWIICYFLGLVYGRNEKHSSAIQINRFNLVFIILSFQNVFQILNDYCFHIIDKENTYYRLWCNFNHVWLGITIFIVLRWVFIKNGIAKTENKVLLSVLNVSDKYSYEAYLVHQFIILGPLSLMTLTKYAVVNIFIIVLLICVMAFSLKSIVSLFEHLISRIKQKRA